MSKDITALLKLLEKESETAIKWFEDNNMIVNPEKFQAIIIDSRNQLQDKYRLRVNNAEIVPKTSVTLLGVEIDNKLNFEKHISSICKKASNQLNALSRIQKFMGQKEKETIINTFIYSNFNYCPLVWHFSTQKSVKKIEKIQERCLRLLLNDYAGNYEEMLKNSGKPTMEVRRLRILATEIFKTLNGLNPVFMRDIFHFSPHLTHKKYNLYVHNRKTSKYGDKSLRVLGAHIWNSLPNNIKSTTSIYKFKDFIKVWFGPQCKCNLCSE